MGSENQIQVIRIAWQAHFPNDQTYHFLTPTGLNFFLHRCGWAAQSLTNINSQEKKIGKNHISQGFQ